MCHIYRELNLKISQQIFLRELGLRNEQKIKRERVVWVYLPEGAL
jgi:hypothetical protein